MSLKDPDLFSIKTTNGSASKALYEKLKLDPDYNKRR